MLKSLRRAFVLVGGVACLLAAGCSSEPETKTEKRSLVAPYEPCAAASECAPLPDRAVRCECAGGDTTVCVEYAAIGEDCFDDAWCPTGSLCLEDGADPEGFHQSCVKLPVEGESCLALPCAAGFACQANLECGPPRAPLESCDEFDLKPCQSGYYCESGTCMRGSPEGGLCRDDRHCPDGSHCRIGSDGLGRCQVSEGGTCEANTDCREGLTCASGVCKAASPAHCEKE